MTNIEIEWDSYYGKGDLTEISSFEKMTGYVLPESYKQIVLKYNGACPENKDTFKYFSQLFNEEVESDIGMFLPFGEIEGVTETMELKYRFKPDGFVNDIIIFSALANGDALCFDYRHKSVSKEPSIVVWHHEGSVEEDNEISLVANGFEQFLEMLYEEE